MAIGPILREARQNKQLTTSQVAEMTRMKVQIVDDLENDDFHRIAATIYGKGFIKLFAECVDLDPEPLIVDYMEQVGTPQPPKLPKQKEQSEETPPPPTEAEPEPEEQTESTEGEESPDDLFAYAVQKGQRKKNVSSESPASIQTTSAPNPNKAPQEIRERIAAITKQTYKQAKDLFTQGLEVIVKRFTEAGEHDKWIQRGLIAIGIIVIIMILIPLGRMMFAPREAASLPDDELILFIHPPEPYLD